MIFIKEKHLPQLYRVTVKCVFQTTSRTLRPPAARTTATTAAASTPTTTPKGS